MNHRQITQGLKEIGAAWAVRSDKWCSPNDPLDDQIKGIKTYHIHPDRSYPHQNSIKRFYSLAEIAAYIRACKKAAQATSDEKGMEIMEDFWAGLK